MELHQDLTYLWKICLGRKTRSHYIPNDVVDHYDISNTQKNTAKKAIVWLLSKAPHTAEEIADHFEMSPQLVAHLLEELMETNDVVKESGRPARYRLPNN